MVRYGILRYSDSIEPQENEYPSALKPGVFGVHLSPSITFDTSKVCAPTPFPASNNIDTLYHDGKP